MSTTFRVVIDGQYYVAPDKDLDAFRDALLSAVRQGGAFVHLGDGVHHQVEVLVTPSTHVRIEHIELSDDDDVPDDGADAWGASIVDDVEW